jgi:hypothetical protein
MNVQCAFEKIETETHTSMVVTNNFAELDMRYAFERDMVRKHGYKAFSSQRGIMGVCEACGDDFDKVRSNQRTCSRPECKRHLTKMRARKHYKKHGEVVREKKRNSDITQAKHIEATFRDLDQHDQDNLVTALIKAACMRAVEEMDVEWIEECLPGAMAAVGEHVDTDTLIDMMNGEHTPHYTRRNEWAKEKTDTHK